MFPQDEHQDSRENKSDCFPWDHTLSVHCSHKRLVRAWEGEPENNNNTAMVMMMMKTTTFPNALLDLLTDA